jgi:hypothetical protein
MDRSRVIVAHFSQSGFRLYFRLSPGESNGPALLFSLQPHLLGGRYEIQRSSDLKNWMTLVVLTNLYGITQFSEPFSTNAVQRFYRAVETPTAP